MAAAGICWLTIGWLPAGDPGRVEIPFQAVGHFIVVQGTIGELDTLNLVIDTGATFTTISRETASRLRLKGNQKKVVALGSDVTVETVTVPRLTLGNLVYEDVPAWVANLAFPDMKEMLRIDALIGLDLLRRTNISIDFENSMLRLGPVTHAPESLAFYGKIPFIMLPLQVQGVMVRLMLDTGAPDLILFKKRTQGKLRVKHSGETKGIHSGAGRAVLKKVQLGQVSLGQTSWDSLPGFLLDGQAPDSGIDGIVGPTSLGLRRLHLDFASNRVSWEK